MSALASPTVAQTPRTGLEAALRASIEKLVAEKQRARKYKATRKWAISAMVSDVTSGESVRGHTLASVLAQECDYARLVPFLVESQYAMGRNIEKMSTDLNNHVIEMARRYFESPAMKDVVEAYRTNDLIRGLK